jgi:endo-1,4-beta-xylanase
MNNLSIFFRNFSKYAIVIFLIYMADPSLAQSTVDQKKGLKDFYQNYFPIGVAVSPQALKGPEAELIKKHFNSVTAENAMKTGPIHPEENRYNWEPADLIVSFAKANGMKMRGHTLCWHNQNPNWLFRNAKGDTITKDVLLKRLKEHITTVVTRYKGTIYAWDVVNEAVDDNNNKFLRESAWYKICGEEYIAKAFEYAHEADPNAKLFYNDYATEDPGKRERIYQLVKKLVEAKVPIHGVGLQGHWSIYEPTDEAIEKSIEKFSALGLDVQITELDVSVYPLEHSRRERRPDDIDTFTTAMDEKQITQYRMLFKVFRDHKEAITGVTFWNVSDKHSWLDSFPVSGRKNYPLLFDQQLQPKKAYWGVITF